MSNHWHNDLLRRWVGEPNRTSERPLPQTLTERRVERARIRTENPSHDAASKRRRNQSLLLRFRTGETYKCVPTPEGERVLSRLEVIGIRSVADYLSFGIGRGTKGDNWRWIFEAYIESFPNDTPHTANQLEEIFHLGQIHSSLQDVRDLRDDAIQERLDDAMKYDSRVKCANPYRDCWRGTAK